MTSTDTQSQRLTEWPHGPVFGPDEPAEPLAEEYSIWLHNEDAKETAMPWRLGDYGGRGVFSSAEVDELAGRHGLSRKDMRTLSKQVAFCLDADSAVNYVEIKRSVAEERAREQARKAHKAAKKGKFVQAAALIADLTDRFASEPCRSDALAEAKRLGAEGTPDRTAYLRALARLRDTPDAAFDLSPVGKRKAWDYRRKRLVWECCYLFLAIGRPVTYRPTERGTHGGPLIDLIQDIVRRVTERSFTLSPRTIRRDIDLFKDPDPWLFQGDDPRTVYLD